MKESQSAPNSQLFASPNPTTKEITFGEREYAEVAESLCEALQGKSFFSNHTITEHEGFYSLLTTTLIIYRTEPNDPEPRAWHCSRVVGDENLPRRPSALAPHGVPQRFFAQRTPPPHLPRKITPSPTPTYTQKNDTT